MAGSPPRVGSRAAALGALDPDRPALRDPVASLTYGELRDHLGRVRANADRLAALTGPDRTVAIVADRSVRSVATMLGLMMSDYTVGVLDPDWTDAEIAGATEQLGCRTIVGGTRAADARTPVDEIGGLPVTRRDDVVPHPSRPVGADPDIFYVGFTSGSSGRPKAFARTHESWLRSFEGLDRIAPTPEGAVVVPGPLSSSHFLFGALHGLHAGRCVELPAQSGGAAARLAERLDAGEPVGCVYVVPSLLAELTRRLPAPPAVVPEAIHCAGARLDRSVRDAAAARLPGTRIVEYYGASELSFVAIRVDGDGTPDGSVGRAFPGVDVSVLHPDGRPARTGTVGLIGVRSDLTFAGYRGVAPPDAARHIDGWLTVGDLGHLDENGYLHVAGRGSATIISGGANVQPEEVEGVLATVPGIAESAVVGMEDRRWGQIVVAALAVSDDRNHPARADVRSAVESALTGHKRPRRYVVLDAIPRGRSGKVDRDAVRARLSAGEGRELR